MINTKLKCPGCDTELDCKDIKKAIIELIKEKLDEEIK